MKNVLNCKSNLVVKLSIKHLHFFKHWSPALLCVPIYIHSLWRFEGIYPAPVKSVWIWLPVTGEQPATDFLYQSNFSTFHHVCVPKWISLANSCKRWTWRQLCPQLHSLLLYRHQTCRILKEKPACETVLKTNDVSFQPLLGENEQTWWLPSQLGK